MTEIDPQVVRDFARRAILAAADEVDYLGIGEQFSDEEGWPDEEGAYDAMLTAVDAERKKATVTVTWSDEQATADFFEPGIEYDDATAYSAPEIIRSFSCVAVAKMPGTGELVAFGFMRTDGIGWGGTGLSVDHWRKGWNRHNTADDTAGSAT